MLKPTAGTKTAIYDLTTKDASVTEEKKYPSTGKISFLLDSMASLPVKAKIAFSAAMYRLTRPNLVLVGSETEPPSTESG